MNVDSGQSKIRQNNISRKNDINNYNDNKTEKYNAMYENLTSSSQIHNSSPKVAWSNSGNNTNVKSNSILIIISSPIKG